MKTKLLALAVVLLLLTACGTKKQAAASDPKPESSPSSVSGSASAPSSLEPSFPEPEEPSTPGSSSAPEGSPQPSKNEEKPLYFSLGPEGEARALRVGDTLGSWTLQSCDVNWDEEVNGKPWVDGAVFTAPTDAPVEINCIASLDGMSPERRYNFTVAEDDLDKMPVMEGDTRSVWFSADNSAALTELADLDSGETRSCRVAMSKYTFVSIPMMARNGADVVWMELE